MRGGRLYSSDMPSSVSDRCAPRSGARPNPSRTPPIASCAVSGQSVSSVTAAPSSTAPAKPFAGRTLAPSAVTETSRATSGTVSAPDASASTSSVVLTGTRTVAFVAVPIVTVPVPTRTMVPACSPDTIRISASVSGRSGCGGTCSRLRATTTPSRTPDSATVAARSSGCSPTKYAGVRPDATTSVAMRRSASATSSPTARVSSPST